MVSAFATCVAAVLALTASTSVSAAELKLGDYFRPSGAEVSGFPTVTDAQYFRTPCPALNTLANHGYLPRDGKNVTSAVLRNALTDRFNVDAALAQSLVSSLPATFNLNLLGKHGFIEHDTSLVHADSAFGADPATIDATLLNDVLGRAETFTVATMGAIRKDRLAACKANNPTCTFGAKESSPSFGEAALVLIGFGDITTETAPLARVRSFLESERFPSGFVPAAQPLTSAKLSAVSQKIVAAAA